MNKFTKINICFILICLSIFFIGCESQYLGGDRNTRWIKDLNYMQKAIPQKHINPFFKTNEEKFNSELTALKNSVYKLNDDQILSSIYKIIASIGDTHTCPYKKASIVYPIQFYYFKEGIYVINTLPEYKKALYTKLVKINGINIETIQKNILPLIVTENNALIKKYIPKYLTNAEILHGLNITYSVKNTLFTFENSQGDNFNLNINSLNDENFQGKFIII